MEAETKERVDALVSEHREELQQAQQEARDWMEKYTAAFEQQTKQAGELQALLLKQEYAGRDADVRAVRAAAAVAAAQSEAREAAGVRAAETERFEAARAEQAAALQRVVDQLGAATSAQSVAQRAHAADLLQLQRKHTAAMDKASAEMRNEMGRKDAIISDLRQQLADIEEVFR